MWKIAISSTKSLPKILPVSILFCIFLHQFVSFNSLWGQFSRLEIYSSIDLTHLCEGKTYKFTVGCYLGEKGRIIRTCG